MKKNEHYNFFADSAQSFTYVVDVISILSQHNSPCKFLIIYIFFNDFWSPKGDLKKKDLNLSPAVFVSLSMSRQPLSRPNEDQRSWSYMYIP